MKPNLYRVNEIFLSVQAEGHNAGKAAVFVRFSGCNLKCPWCDTDHAKFKLMTADQIDDRIEKLCKGDKRIYVVFTGGEPTLQLREDEIIGMGHYTCIETNGTRVAPQWINWVTVSPKIRLPYKRLEELGANELKVVYTGKSCETDLELYEKEISKRNVCTYLYVQPLEHKGKMNVKKCIDFIRRHPTWTLSVQWHKLTGVR